MLRLNFINTCAPHTNNRAIGLIEVLICLLICSGSLVYVSKFLLQFSECSSRLEKDFDFGYITADQLSCYNVYLDRDLCDGFLQHNNTTTQVYNSIFSKCEFGQK